MQKILKLKNTLKVEVPFYKIPSGETGEVTITQPDDIHYRGIELGHLVLVDEKTSEIIEIPKAIIVSKPKKKVR